MATTVRAFALHWYRSRTDVITLDDDRARMSKHILPVLGDRPLSDINPTDVLAVLNTWYDPDKDWPPVVRRKGHGDLIAAGATM